MNTSNPLARGALGVAGGVAGLLAMRLYWTTATFLSGTDPRMLTRPAPPDTLDDVSAVGSQRREGESSTAAVGRQAYEAVADDRPGSGTRKALSYGVHWSYGLLMGGLYSTLRGKAGGTDLQGGAAFGAALWALGDELAIPLLGLSKGPTAYPLQQHAHRLGAHLVYGVATSAATQTLLRLADPPKPVGWAARLGWGAAKQYARFKATSAATQTLFGAVKKLRR